MRGSLQTPHPEGKDYDRNVMRFYDASDKVSVTRRKLPHWSQAGTVAFITWRLHDSLPRPLIERFLNDRKHWLSLHHIDVTQPGWRAKLASLQDYQLHEYHRRFTDRWHLELDAGHGEAFLRRPDLAAVVADSLQFFDGDRYELHDFVVMPNHVHVLAVFPDHEAMTRQCESWKRFTGTQINKMLDRKGRFWQQDSYDHLVRHQEQYVRLSEYIVENPVKARLRAGEFVLYNRERPMTE